MGGTSVGGEANLAGGGPVLGVERQQLLEEFAALGADRRPVRELGAGSAWTLGYVSWTVCQSSPFQHAIVR